MSSPRKFIEEVIIESELADKPLHMRAAESIAEELGMSAEELMDSIYRRMEETIYPTKECLSPDEITLYIEPEEIPVNRRSHIGQCTFCATLVNAQPSPEKIREVEHAIASRQLK